MKKRPDTPETVRIKATLARNVTDAARAALFAPPREPTPRERAMTRALAGLPIEDTRELILNMLELRARVTEHTQLWYLTNRLIRDAMDHADAEERKPK